MSGPYSAYTEPNRRRDNERKHKVQCTLQAAAAAAATASRRRKRFRRIRADKSHASPRNSILYAASESALTFRCTVVGGGAVSTTLVFVIQFLPHRRHFESTFTDRPIIFCRQSFGRSENLTAAAAAAAVQTRRTNMLTSIADDVFDDLDRLSASEREQT